MSHTDMAVKLKQETGKCVLECLRAAAQYPENYEKAKEYLLSHKSLSLCVEVRN